MRLNKIRWFRIIVGLSILLMTTTPVQANVDYDSNLNTILLKSGTNTLESIYSEINDSSVLSYDGSVNAYTLSANISGEKGITSHLVLENATLIINNTADATYSIITFADLVINNMKIKPMDYSYQWVIRAYSRFTEYSVFINFSDISGGRITVKPNGYQVPRTPTIITNNRFHDFTMNEIFNYRMLSLELNAGSNGFIYNNTFYNISIIGIASPPPGVLYINAATNCLVDKISISNVSLSAHGGISFYGGSENAIISNFTIKNIIGSGLSGKEYGDVSYIKGTITNVSTNGIFFYHSIVYGNVLNKVWGVKISGANVGINSNSNSYVTADIYNVTIDDVNTAFSTGLYSKNIFYITNTLVTNYNSLYNVPSGEIREYVLTDLYVVDNENNPVDGAKITITANEPNVDDYSINRNLQSLTQITTLSNGHTALPSENLSATVSVLRYRKNATSEAQYTYTVTAEKNGQSNSTVIYPESSWYRSNPNAYQNTTTIILPLVDTDSTVSDTPVSITPSTSQTTPNTPFTLTIPVTPATPIAGAQFDLNYDGSMATVTSVTEGNLLNQNGATTLFNSGTIDNVAGTVTNVYGSILGATSVSSQGSLATISMTAGGNTGYLNLDLSNVVISDANSAAVPYTLTNATILVDTAPVLNTIGAKSVDEGSALTFTTSASDADGDSLTYSATNLPTGASFNTATGAFSWTPADGQAGTYVITFEVTDGYISDSEDVTITVNDANHAPVITTFVPANSLTYNESDVITIGIIATDADGQALSYTIKIDGVTQSTSSSYVWETDYSSAGSHTIDIIVSDGIEQVTDQRTITVNDVRPRWDVNEDGTVNVLDISIIGQKYGASVEAPYPRWDVNQDGDVNVQDMTLAAYYFGETVV